MKVTKNQQTHTCETKLNKTKTGLGATLPENGSGLFYSYCKHTQYKNAKALLHNKTCTK